jgi:hypothetical protein
MLIISSQGPMEVSAKYKSMDPGRAEEVRIQLPLGNSTALSRLLHGCGTDLLA